MFDNYPVITYDILSPENQIVIDYFYRIEFFYNFKKENLKFFETYQVKDFETPESIATDRYQEPKYYFLILLLNNRVDPFFDWILSNDELLEYAQKFVTENPDEVSSYVASHPAILTNFNSQYGTSYTTYSPVDPTDINDPLVNCLIGTYYNQLSDENNARRPIYLPDNATMQRLYASFMKISSQFGS